MSDHRRGLATRTRDLGRSLCPLALQRIGLLESSLIFVAALGIALFRLGPSSLRGVVWAEDGAVFLQDAHRSSLAADLLAPHAGYALVLPRLIAEVVSWGPLASQGVLLAVSAAVVQAAMALLGYHVVSAHASTRLAGAASALVVSAVPVGPEVIDNIANLQWFLLSAGCLVPLWIPRRRIGTVVSALTILAVATTCPFGFVPVGLAGLAWLATRSRTALLTLLLGVWGVLVQLIVVLTAPPRPGLEPMLDPSVLGQVYLRRVLGDGFLGAARHGADPYPRGTLEGVLVLVALTVAIVFVATLSARRVFMPVLLMILSLVLLVLPVGVGNSTDFDSLFTGRYFVAPVILVVTATGLLADAAFVATRAVRPRRVTTTRLLLGGLVACAIFGMASSWRVSDRDPRMSSPSWSDSVAVARSRCVHRPVAVEKLPVSPKGWFTVLSCRDLLGSEGRKVS